MLILQERLRDGYDMWMLKLNQRCRLFLAVLHDLLLVSFGKRFLLYYEGGGGLVGSLFGSVVEFPVAEGSDGAFGLFLDGVTFDELGAHCVL